MSEPSPTVFVVDEDASVRETLGQLIHACGMQAALYPRAKEFLDHPRAVGVCCLVLDVRLPDLDGLELLARLALDACEIPVVCIADSVDVKTVVMAMKAGALEFLTKPLKTSEALSAIRGAIDCSRATQVRARCLSALRARQDQLTVREREVMGLVTTGHLNKVAAWKLGVSELTVKVYRGRVMRKMQAKSLAHLVDMARYLGQISLAV